MELAHLVAALGLVVTAVAVEVLESTTRSLQSKYDVAAKQQTLDEKVTKARPAFFYQKILAGDSRSTASTKLSSLSGPTSWSSSSGLSGGLSRGLSVSGGFSSDHAPEDFRRGVSSGSPVRLTRFSSDLSRVYPDRFPSSGSFAGGLSDDSPVRLSSSRFSSALSSRSPGLLSSTGSFSSSSGGFSSGLSDALPISSSTEILGGFSPSFSPFGSTFADSGRASFDEDSPTFQRTPSTAFTYGSSGGDHLPDSESETSETRESSSSSSSDGAGDLGEHAEHAVDDGGYKREYLHTRDFRDTRSVGDAAATPGEGAGEAAASWGRDRPAGARSRTARLKRRRQPKAKQHNYGEQEYRTPYTENRDNSTDYKYYEDHGGNDTHREHHYRHVQTYHNYYNASDNGSNPYSKDAAYDAMRQARTPANNYNVDHVYKDGRYIPIVHKVAGNLSEGEFPDGPNVKHHYYYNEYAHDHRNKSEGPTVRHHYHDKDVKVFYHDHRNSSTTYSPSPYSSTYSPGKYSSTYSPSKYSTSTYSPSQQSSSEGPRVKHHHTVKEYHYDEHGRLIDPSKYNYTNKYGSNYSSSSAEESPADPQDVNYGTEESRGSFSEHSDHGSGDGYSSGSGDGQDEEETSTSTSTASRDHHYSNYEAEPPQTTRRPYTRHEPDPRYAPVVPNSVSNREYPRHGRRPYSSGYSSGYPSGYSGGGYRPHPTRTPIGYQVQYRDYGDHSFASKEVSFDDGFAFHKERRAGPFSYHETTYRAAAGTLANDTEDPPRYGRGYRPGLVTRDVEGATGLGHGKRLAPDLVGPRAFPDHTRSLVSRGNIGYILVDPLGELPTIRLHASLVNPQAAAAFPPRYAPPSGPATGPAPAPGHGRGYFGAPAEPGGPVTVLRRADDVTVLTTAAPAALAATTKTPPSKSR